MEQLGNLPQICKTEFIHVNINYICERVETRNTISIYELKKNVDVLNSKHSLVTPRASVLSNT